MGFHRPVTISGISGLPAICLHRESSGRGSTPVDSTVQLFASQRLCRLLSASLAFVYTTPTMNVAHVQDLVSLFIKGLTGGDMETNITF